MAGVLSVLVCCAAGLWLMAACGDGAYEYEYPCGALSSTEKGNMQMTTEDTINTSERIHEVRLKYDDLFWRQPNVHAVGEGFFSDEEGGYTETDGIVVTVTKKVDQSTLPVADRIPDCLEGVPVQIEEREPPTFIGTTKQYHRPLVSGIHIASGREVEDESLQPRLEHIASGTLTGLATRQIDGKKVLVTNLHVMAGLGPGDTFREPIGGEEMYQELVATGKKVGSKLDWVRLSTGNVIDMAICELEDDVAAKFTLHNHPTHTDRKIVGGVEEPTKYMRLTMMGQQNGEGPVTVKRINETINVTGTTFNGVVELDCSQRISAPGDSGSACLYEDSDGNYRMACIVFASKPLERLAWAVPASTAERLLGITFGNRSPVADAGPGQAVVAGATVTLDGSNSFDPDQDELTYSWEQAPGVGGSAIMLTGATTATPTFTAPTAPAALTFTLTVTDPYGASATETTSVHVAAYPPAADAGEDLTAKTRYPVELHGEETTGKTRLKWRWEQRPGGPRVTLNHPHMSYSWFTAPESATTLRFRLTVTDRHGTEDCDEVTVVVVNRPPVALAPDNQSVGVGNEVALAGGASDPDAGDTLTHVWTQIEGTKVEITHAESEYARFYAPSSPDTLRFRFTVTDNHGASHYADCAVRVT